MSYLKRTHIEIARHVYMVTILTLIMLVVALIPLGMQRVSSTGSDSFGLSPASGSYSVGQTFTVNVSETSVDQVDSAQANLTYDSSRLQLNSVTPASAPFNIVGQATGGSGTISIGVAVGSGYTTGTQPIATLSFTALSTTGTASLRIASSSLIYLHSDGSNVWNGVQTAGSYTISAPSSGGGTSGGGTTGGGTSSGGGTTSGGTTSGGGSTSNGTTSAPKPSSAAPAPTTTTPATATKPTPTITDAPVPTTAVGSNDESTKPVPFTLLILGSNGKPQPNAKVTINDITVKTNSKGIASFTNLPANFYTASILLPGSKTPVTHTITVAPHAQQQQLVVKLASSETFLNLQPAEIIAIVIVLLAVAAAIGIHYLLEHHLLPDNPLFHLGEPHLAVVGVPGATAVKPSSDDAPPPVAIGEAAASHPVPGQIIMPAATEPDKEDDVQPVPVVEPAPAEIHPLIANEPIVAHGTPGQVVHPGESTTPPTPAPEPSSVTTSSPAEAVSSAPVHASELHKPVIPSAPLPDETPIKE